MAMRVLAVVVGIVGLYFAIWHSGVPFNHFEVFGRGFGGQHTVHAIIGLALLVVAVWLWLRARKLTAATMAR
ncbi:MAG TPA: hypothetical protein VF998_05140 [Candidatus Limnocylindria bacterium]